MSESLPPHLKSCTQCGAELPAEGTNGLCPACLMGEAMQPTIVSDASKPKTHSAILTPEELAPLFPQYEILRMLGRGGMGAVYLARQISLNRLVAIKILPADLGDSDQGFAERFKNEAQAMARLSHPGIVAVYDFGQTSNGLLYIVMEYIEGTDVQLMLTSQGRLHSAHAMAITAHVCDALQYAHSCGIIHRDIKPSNIMVGNNGVVKVADFGLAKMSQGQTTGLTQSGMAMGTLHFMAPEALTLGSAVDQRADIYAVGVMLYQMLTGKLPQGMFEMPSFQVPGLDPRYDRIVARALRDDREQRYQAAAELRHDLDAILTQPVEKTAPDAVTEVKALPPVEQRGKRKARVPSLPSPNAAAPAPARKKPVGLILTVLGVAVAVVAAFVYYRDHKTGPTTTQPELATKERPFINTLGMKFVPVPGTNILICVHETRNKDYAAFAEESTRVKQGWRKSRKDGVLVGEGDEHPMASATWNDANDFCVWLSKREGRTYRLPTDREWSFAVGIGDREEQDGTPAALSGKIKDEFPWGKMWPPIKAVGNYADLTAKKQFPKTISVQEDYTDGYATLASVMSFEPNQLGVFDLGGNVSEWCDDWYDVSHTAHVLRGGSWVKYGYDALLSSCRDSGSNDLSNPYSYGFRVVVESSAQIVSPSASLPVSQSSPATATQDAPFINTLGMKFVPVPITGGPTDGKRVLFCIHETRKADYTAFAEANPSVDYSWSHPNKIGDVPISPAGDHPVVSVNWRDAQAFCAWLSQKEGRRYRLPTDHEWSCASGIGDREDANESPQSKSGKVRGIYSWGIEWPPPKGAGNFDDDSRQAKQPAPGGEEFKGYDDGFTATAPVMSFSPNKQGLYDLGGNVWEWCEDWWNAEQKNRVQRGACYTYGYALSSARSNLDPEIRRSCDGFRVVLDDPPLMVNVQTPPPSPTALPSTVPLKINSEAVTKDAPFVNTLGMKFVPVPETGVLFCIHETRRQDYAAYARESPDVDAMWQSQQRDGFQIGGVEDHPVVSVSWNDANKFCDWLSRKEGRTYRLPTDLEWSLAAGIAAKEDWTNGRIPDARNQRVPDEWPWGRVFPPKADDRAGNYADERWHKSFPGTWVEGYDDGFVTTAPVMSYKPNQFGIYDLGGNVWEWCADWSNARQTFRVLRGGSWSSATPGSLLSSQRNGSNPADRININGFRVVLEVRVPDTAHATPTTKIKEASVEHPFENSMGMKFVPVPGTKVLFCIHETRRQDYASYATVVSGVNRSWMNQQENGVACGAKDDHPVVGASWEEAGKFCEWLSAKEGRRYRLPTDREWSWAAGIGQEEQSSSGSTPEMLNQMLQTEFPWGSQWPPPEGTGNFGDQSYKEKTQRNDVVFLDGYNDGFPTTSPVMSFKPNTLGLHDMDGNIREWVDDWYNSTQMDRVLRGGSWYHGGRGDLLSSNRYHRLPGVRASGYGFRLVLEISNP